MTFSDLGLSPALVKAVEEKGYTKPSPIQEKAIPHILEGKDILASAQTGTGKTAGFTLPVLQHLSETKHPKYRPLRALVLTPTRELAAQVHDNIREYSKYVNIKSTVIFGGVNAKPQISTLKNGIDILVATPGRLLDLINQKFIRLDNIEYFVLDEADRMLDMGFIHDIKKLLALLPTNRQSLFFSATMPNNIKTLSEQILHKPEKIAVNPVSSTAETIQQYLYYTNRADKNALLLHILENPDMQQVLLFSRTKHGADRIVKNLLKKDISSAAIHGNKSQNQRQKALNSFKTGTVRVLVATDIAARGIDIDKLEYVVNFDIPNESETYVHRIGRCGRAGENGIAISICEPEENIFVRDIEKLTKKTIPVVENNPFPQTEKPMTASEKKEFEKEKQKRKQEFFANRKNSRSQNRRKK